MQRRFLMVNQTSIDSDINRHITKAVCPIELFSEINPVPCCKLIFVNTENSKFTKVQHRNELLHNALLLALSPSSILFKMYYLAK